MPYTALIDNGEVEFVDECTLRNALRDGQITELTWIKDVDVEADWQSIGEMFPAWFAPEHPGDS